MRPVCKQGESPSCDLSCIVLKPYHLTMSGLSQSQDSGRLDGAPVSIGVAISGGGVRAAFFGLGALLYLVHTALHKRVRLISSVSGGSISNVVAALAGDYSKVDRHEFDRLASQVSHQMARRGVFFWPGLKRIIVTILALPVFGPLVMAGMIVMGEADKWDWGLVWLAGALYAVSMTIYMLLYFFFRRSGIQRKAYRNFIKKVCHRSNTRHYPKQLQELPESDVTHVICSTELTSGQPFYMSRTMVFSPLYGSGTPNLSLPQAMYASAAFPIGFPPLRLRAKRLHLSGGLDDCPPARLLLSDGGVFNNLATETFSAENPEQIFLPDPSQPIFPAVGQHLVVNASSPPRKASLGWFPILHNMRTAKRIISVLYENTLSPRVKQLMHDQATRPGGPIVIDIAESPVELVDRILDSRTAGDPIHKRATETRALLESMRSDSMWKEYSDRAASTKTVLSAVGKNAVRLVRLGYLDTAIACNAYLSSEGIHSVPPERWFQDLVGR